MLSTILVGEAEVGKTSLVKGLAYRIQSREIPNCLKNKKILAINFSKFIGSQCIGKILKRKCVTL